MVIIKLKLKLKFEVPVAHLLHRREKKVEGGKHTARNYLHDDEHYKYVNFGK